MTNAKLWRVVLAAGAIAFSSGTCFAAGPTAAEVENRILEITKSEVTEEFARAESLSREITIGPFTITAGPQEDGGFGAILSGEGTKDWRWLNSKPPTADDFAAERSFVRRYGHFEFSADAAWSSKQRAKNQTSLSIKPQVTFGWYDGGRWKDEVAWRSGDESCVLAGLEFSRRAEETVLLPEQTSAIERLKIHEMDDAQLLDFFTRNRACGVIGAARPPIQHLALGIYPDVRYRFGKFEEGGTVYDANQLVVGGGARIYFPSMTRSRWFREAPRISVGYYTVQDTEGSDIPVPDDITEDFIDIEARVLLNLPLNTRLDIAPSASKVSGGDWEVLWEAQLSLESDGEFEPAITYRSGVGQGFEFDKQLILGFLWKLTQ